MTAPTSPGWWWRGSRAKDGQPIAVPVWRESDWPDAKLLWTYPHNGATLTVDNDGRWIAPVLAPSKASALTARAEAAESTLALVREWAADDSWRDDEEGAHRLHHDRCELRQELRAILDGSDR